MKPVWRTGVREAWWQNEKQGVAVEVHDHRDMVFGTINQSRSQDLDPNTTAYAYRPIAAGQTERFLSVLVPHELKTRPEPWCAESRLR